MGKILSPHTPLSLSQTDKQILLKKGLQKKQIMNKLGLDFNFFFCTKTNLSYHSISVNFQKDSCGTRPHGTAKPSEQGRPGKPHTNSRPGTPQYHLSHLQNLSWTCSQVLPADTVSPSAGEEGRRGPQGDDSPGRHPECMLMAPLHYQASARGMGRMQFWAP